VPEPLRANLHLQFNHLKYAKGEDIYMSICQFCEKQVIGRRLCRSHYYKARRAGSLEAFQKKYRSLKERLLEKIYIAENGCWLWTAQTNSYGYALIWHSGKCIRAHRASYEIFKEALVDSQVVCHKCDTPACVNPDHLFVGTRLDNNQDAVKKMRHAFGQKNGKTRLTRNHIHEILTDHRPQHEIAKSYGVSQSHISRIKNNKVWTIR
jgi:hypothetical protein